MGKVESTLPPFDNLEQACRVGPFWWDNAAFWHWFAAGACAQAVACSALLLALPRIARGSPTGQPTGLGLEKGALRSIGSEGSRRRASICPVDPYVSALPTCEADQEEPGNEFKASCTRTGHWFVAGPRDRRCHTGRVRRHGPRTDGDCRRCADVSIEEHHSERDALERSHHPGRGGEGRGLGGYIGRQRSVYGVRTDQRGVRRTSARHSGQSAEAGEQGAAREDSHLPRGAGPLHQRVARVG